MSDSSGLGASRPRPRPRFAPSSPSPFAGAQSVAVSYLACKKVVLGRFQATFSSFAVDPQAALTCSYR